MSQGSHGCFIQRILCDIKHPVRRWGYIFVFPGILYFAVFIAYPIIWGFVLSLTDTRGLGSIGDFVGIRNYVELFTEDPAFIRSFINTFLYVLMVVPGIVLAALFIGVMLERNVLGKGVLRVIYFVPAITSVIAVGVVWTWLYDPTFGLFNQILKLIGLPTMAFLKDKFEVLPSIALMGIWQRIGYNVIIVQAGIMGIPNEYYEAAHLDGAKRWQLMLYITIPLLMPIITYMVVTNTITNLQVFDQIFIMTNGGPGDASRTVAFHLYETAFSYQWFGKGSAIAFVLFLIIVTITFINMKLLKKKY